MRRGRRAGFGWAAEQHQEIADEQLATAELHIGEVRRNADHGFCITALEALTMAANALGSAAHGFNAAGKAPGAMPEFRRVYKTFVDARKHIARKCMSGRG